MNLLKDIYYRDEYISLYIQENEELFSFEYREKDNLFINKSIKRRIDKIGSVGINDGYYDLETAYGYGGFYTNTDNKNFLKNALSKYEKKCKDERIIAEFIRFHPFNTFAQKNEEFLDFNLYDRDVVVKSLSNDILSSYTSKTRNTVKRAVEKVFFKETTNIEKFESLYNSTMKKNNASEFYFFDKLYYKNLLSQKAIKLYEIIIEDEVVAMGFFMLDDELGHYHLSANTAMSYKNNSNYALLHHLFLIAQEEGIKYFILGGGSTSSKDDTLFKFKKKFSKELKPFYISGKIYNGCIYEKYNKIWREQSSEDIKYFLKYRLEII